MRFFLSPPQFLFACLIKSFRSLFLTGGLFLTACVSPSPPAASAPLGRQDLVSGRPDASAVFYREVFGWSVAPRGTASYREWHTEDGQTVGGLVAFPDAGDAAVWLTTLDVENLQQTVATVIAQGGALLHGPVTVRGGARTAVIADPDGGRLQLREGARQPVQSVWIWHELLTRDPAAAATWYGAVFGFTSGDAASERILLFRGESPVAGISPNPFVDQESQWIPVLGIHELSPLLAAIPRHGGEVIHVSTDTNRRVALVADPQHAPLLLQEIGEVTP